MFSACFRILIFSTFIDSSFLLNNIFSLRLKQGPYNCILQNVSKCGPVVPGPAAILYVGVGTSPKGENLLNGSVEVSDSVSHTKMTISAYLEDQAKSSRPIRFLQFKNLPCNDMKTRLFIKECFGLETSTCLPKGTFDTNYNVNRVLHRLWFKLYHGVFLVKFEFFEEKRLPFACFTLTLNITDVQKVE